MDFKCILMVVSVLDGSRLEKLLAALEYGKNIRITVLPLTRNPVSGEMFLSADRIIHSHPFCQTMKNTRSALEKCLACKELAINKAVVTGKAYGGTCVHGCYEAVSPVKNGDKTEYVVFVGGIYNKNEKRSKKAVLYRQLLEQTEDTEYYKNLAETVSDAVKTYSLAYPCSTFDREGRNTRAEFAVIDYADAYYSGEISLKNLANVFYLNEKYLGRLFKKNTGLSFSEYINKKRLEKAAEMLIGTDRPIIEIALDCGFNNVTYFYRLFKRKYDLSPAFYRKVRKGNKL